MTTIYRGFSVTSVPNGFTIHSMGSYPVVAVIFETEEAAMNRIDEIKEAARLSLSTQPGT
jgi:hypothetical protein